MRESYSNENQFGFKTLNPAINKIVIVGGYGKNGAVICPLFTCLWLSYFYFRSDDWDMAERILTNADVVIISVPIDHTLETIERLKPYLTENMLLADLTSVKRAPLAKMLDVHKGL